MRKYVGLIGRRAELKLLNNVYELDEAFVVLSGIDHVGKSTLARYFVSDKPSLSFQARELADELNRRTFFRQILSYYRGKANQSEEIPDWLELFRLYSEYPEPERKVLILDNLEYLIRANSSFQRILKTAWEKYLKPQNVMLLCIIRQGSVMINLKSNHSPILNSATLKLTLGPVSFLEMLRDYPHRSFEELVSLYAITGGIPMYWRFFDNTPALIDQLGVVREEMLTPTGWFYSEPIHEISSEVYEPIEYLSVLQAIGEGKYTLGTICDFLKYKPKNVQNCLDNLQELGIIKAVLPVTERRNSGRKAHWHFAEPFFDFWFTFIYPRRDQLQTGNTLKAYEFIQQNFEAYAEYWFSQISVEIFLASLKQKSYAFSCDKIGTFWDRDDNLVDIAAVDKTSRKLFLGECIYAGEKPSLQEFEKFIQECEELKDLKAYRDYTRVYGLFTTQHPERELIDFAMTNPNIMVFEGTMLYRKKEIQEG